MAEAGTPRCREAGRRPGRVTADARAREQIDWLAEEILEVGGTATVWVAQPGSVARERSIAAKLAADPAAEYQHIVREAEAVRHSIPEERSRAARLLRARLRRITRRDYFPPAERERAETAVRALAARQAASPHSRRGR